MGGATPAGEDCWLLGKGMDAGGGWGGGVVTDVCDCGARRRAGLGGWI